MREWASRFTSDLVRFHRDSDISCRNAFCDGVSHVSECSDPCGGGVAAEFDVLQLHLTLFREQTMGSEFTRSPSTRNRCALA